MKETWKKDTNTRGFVSAATKTEKDETRETNPWQRNKFGEQAGVNNYMIVSSIDGNRWQRRTT